MESIEDHVFIIKNTNKQDHLQAIYGANALNALWDIAQYFRELHKYQDIETISAEDAKNKVYEYCRHNGFELEDLVS